MSFPWNPFRFCSSRAAQQNGDQNDEQYPGLFDLPCNIRLSIWDELDVKEHKALRLTSRECKRDIDKYLGLRVTLHGEPVKKLSALERIMSQILPGSRTAEIEAKARANIQWIERTYITGLSIKRISQLPSLDLKDLLKPALRPRLRHFSIELDFMDMNTIAMQVITHNRLKSLNVRILKPPINDEVANFHSYQAKQRLNVHSLFIQILRFQSYRLEKLSLGIDNHVLWKFWNLIVSFPAIPIVTQNLEAWNDEAQDIVEESPVQLKSLKLNFPIQLEDQFLLLCRIFLNNQFHLRKLLVDFRFIYWRYFSEVVANNAQRLRKLDLCLSNYAHGRFQGTWMVFVPATEQLDWSAFILPVQKLRSLKISMSEMQRSCLDQPKPTVNFRSLTLNRLKSLELNFVELNQQDLTHIFSNFPSLCRVHLTYWNAQFLQNYMFQGHWILEPVYNVLLENRFEKIYLEDICLIAPAPDLVLMIKNAENYRTSFWQDDMDLFLHESNEWSEEFKPIQKTTDKLVWFKARWRPRAFLKIERKV